MFQIINLKTQSRFIYATDLINASNKKHWFASLILNCYKLTVRNKNEAFVSYSDDLIFVFWLKLPTEWFKNAMNKNVSQIFIEIFKNKMNATNKKTYLIIHIWLFMLFINATNLLAVRKCHRICLFSLLHCAEIYDIYYKIYEIQKIYISYADDFCLFNVLEFSKADLDQIKNAIEKDWINSFIHM